MSSNINPRRFDEIVSSIKLRKRNLLDLSLKTGIRYDSLHKFLRGYRLPPSDLFKKIEIALTDWDKEDQLANANNAMCNEVLG